MAELSFEKSLEEAKTIRQISFLSLQLDIEYLTEALKQMKEQHSFRDSAMILNPHPHVHNEMQDLTAAKIRQLELFIEIAKYSHTIQECETKLIKAKESDSELSKIFGV